MNDEFLDYYDLVNNGNFSYNINANDINSIGSNLTFVDGAELKTNYDVIDRIKVEIDEIKKENKDLNKKISRLTTIILTMIGKEQLKDERC